MYNQVLGASYFINHLLKVVLILFLISRFVGTDRKFLYLQIQFIIIVVNKTSKLDLTNYIYCDNCEVHLNKKLVEDYFDRTSLTPEVQPHKPKFDKYH